jgi:hypothetical protein
MSDWNTWKPAFDLVTIKKDGDSLEIRGATEHGLDVVFPNFEIFWRYHVVPATNRPANIEFRHYASNEITRIATLSHSLFIDIVNAADSLAKINAGDLGGDRFRNCTDAIKSSGDAVQKFTDLQKAIEDQLAPALGSTIRLWSGADWNNIWFPSREKIINYRNFLTHSGYPQVMHVPQPDGSRVPFVLHQDYIVRGNYLTWPEQEEIFRNDPSKWAKLVDVCNELQSETIKWLNDVYLQAINALHPFLTSEDYHHLWGWDTVAHGRHITQSGGAMGAQGPVVITSPAASGQNYP